MIPPRMAIPIVPQPRTVRVRPLSLLRSAVPFIVRVLEEEVMGGRHEALTVFCCCSASLRIQSGVSFGSFGSRRRDIRFFVYLSRSCRGSMLSARHDQRQEASARVLDHPKCRSFGRSRRGPTPRASTRRHVFLFVLSPELTSGIIDLRGSLRVPVRIVTTQEVLQELFQQMQAERKL